MKKSLKLFVALLFMLSYVPTMLFSATNFYAAETERTLVDNDQIKVMISYTDEQTVRDWKVDYTNKSKQPDRQNVKLRFKKNQLVKDSVRHVFKEKSTKVVADKEHWFNATFTTDKQGSFTFKTPTNLEALEFEIQVDEQHDEKKEESKTILTKDVLDKKSAGPYVVSTKNGMITSAKKTDLPTTETSLIEEKPESSIQNSTVDPAKSEELDLSVDEKSESAETSEAQSTPEASEVPETLDLPSSLETSERLYLGERAKEPSQILAQWEKQLEKYPIDDLEFTSVDYQAYPQQKHLYTGVAKFASDKTIVLKHQVEVESLTHQIDFSFESESVEADFSNVFSAKRISEPNEFEQVISGKMIDDMIIFSGLGVGSYEITEKVPEGVQAAGPWLLHVTKEQDTVKTELKEKNSGKTISTIANYRNKVSAVFIVENNQHEPLKDVEFELYNQAQGTKKAISDENGQIIFDNLALGEYQLIPRETMDYDQPISELAVVVQEDQVQLKIAEQIYTQKLDDQQKAVFSTAADHLRYRFKPYELRVVNPTDSVDYSLKNQQTGQIVRLEKGADYAVLKDLSLGKYDLYESQTLLTKLEVLSDGTINPTDSSVKVDQDQRLVTFERSTDLSKPVTELPNGSEKAESEIKGDQLTETETAVEGEAPSEVRTEPILPVETNVLSQPLASTLPTDFKLSKVSDLPVASVDLNADAEEAVGYLPETGGVGLHRIWLMAAIFGIGALTIGSYVLYRNRKEAG